MVASAIDVIIHTARLSDGSRKILAVTELVGLVHETEIVLEDLFVFRQTGLDEHGRVLGLFTPTGELPSFFEEAKTKGLPLPAEMFRPTVH